MKCAKWSISDNFSVVLIIVEKFCQNDRVLLTNWLLKALYLLTFIKIQSYQHR